MGQSLAERAARQVGAAALFASLTEEEQEQLTWLWPAWARPEQLAPPGDWLGWLILAGRGFGKTRCGAEWVRAEVEEGRRGRIALVAPTAADARDTMIEGESGILAVSPPWFRPKYEPSKRRLTWPNGAIATAFSAEEPDRLRGPQHDGFWGDEPAAWDDPDAVWAMLLFGLRLGERPRGVLTTTPRPIPFIRRLLVDRRWTTTRGSTYENAANLAPDYLEAIRAAYEGTRLGRQEIHAEVLDDNPGALWKRKRLEELRVRNAPEMRKIVVAVDPAVSSREGADETGIIVCGRGVDGHGYALEDQSGVYTPKEWAEKVIEAHVRWNANMVVAEVNQGGDLVEANLRANGGQHLAFKAVHAARGKDIRAEPIAALTEQGRAHTLYGMAKLEDQLCEWNPLTDPFSPDRLDAYVWGMTELMLEPMPTPFSRPPGVMMPRRI